MFKKKKKNILILLGLAFVEPLIGLGLYLLRNKIQPSSWRTMLIVFLITIFIRRIYHFARASKWKHSFILFWSLVRILIYIAEIFVVVGMYAYIFLGK